MLAPWKKSYDQPRQHIKKQRHCFANKSPSSQRYGFSSSHVQIWSVIHLSHSVMLPPWTGACQASLSITSFRSLHKLMSIESVMPYKHLILCCPLSSGLQSLPASGSFPRNQFFTSGGQSIGVSTSASVLPMNIQDLFSLGLTGLILQSKGLSRVFSNTTVQKHQFFSTQLSL